MCFKANGLNLEGFIDTDLISNIDRRKITIDYAFILDDIAL